MPNTQQNYRREIEEANDRILDIHKENTVEAIKQDFLHHLKFTLAKNEYNATDNDRRIALALTVRDRLIERWMQTNDAYYDRNVKRVYYLSMEYLIGRAMGNNVINLDLEDSVSRAMQDLGLDWNDLREEGLDAGLGNGGLGRLAACFLDSIATLQLPGIGYGVRYDYGIFRQEIRDGFQVEEPDNWLWHGDPWQIERPEYQVPVYFGGSVRQEHSPAGEMEFRWVDRDAIYGVPYDFPVPGYRNNTVNNLRLWTAKASEEFDLEFFNNGDYIRAYEQKLLSENITKVLYPNDAIEKGRELRFKQEYFFVSCSLQDIIRRYKVCNDDVSRIHEKVAVQLNDTHPAIAVAEWMRLLMDDEGLIWDVAWNATVQTFAYTNHTLMPEALERWPVWLFEALLPRHLQIIYEINRRFLREVMTKWPDDHERVRAMSLIEEGDVRQVRMAYLALVGSHRVNGVSRLHSDLLKSDLFRPFHDLYPERFTNKTNGITPRRWLLKCNPSLAELISDKIGGRWVTDLDRLKEFEAFADDPDTLGRLREIKHANKERLAALIFQTLGVTVSPDMLFDSQIKRLHEYKRQLLNVLHILYHYFLLKEDPSHEFTPRACIFAAKAAPGYQRAKLIIKFINDIGGIINSDRDVDGRLKVVFLPDYRVSLAERIIPGTDLSEQISTAGMEASGTGNMKLALNGALTIGTLDGANIEIREQVGAENFFLFGKTAEEIDALRRDGGYNPWEVVRGDPVLHRILDAMEGEYFNLEQPGLFRPLRHALLDEGDYYFNLADFHDYLRVQREVNDAYADPDRWASMCVRNIANMGPFSSDRTIRQYAEDIWGVEPCPVTLQNGD
jgi:glycogen phosphorylase